MDKLTIEDCEKAIAALNTSQMKDSLMARSLVGMHQQLLDTLRENERLRSALKIAQTAMNDWTCQYADDMVGDAAFNEAKERVSASGGTLGYISDVQTIIGLELDPYKHTEAEASILRAYHDSPVDTQPSKTSDKP